MASASEAVMADADSREISATRVFDAPRRLVWKAWSSPENIGQWWGPQGFTTTTKEFEMKPGGRWIFTMHGPDGTNYPNEITYTTIRENEIVEYEHGPSPKFSVTVRFEDEGEGRTKLSFRMVFESVEERDNVAVKFGAIEGLNQTLGRLREFVASGTLKEE